MFLKGENFDASFIKFRRTEMVESMAIGVRPTRLQEEDDGEQERKNRREKQAQTK